MVGDAGPAGVRAGGDLPETPVVSVRDLSVWTSTGACLIDRVSFALGPGSRQALIGETGSGKSLTALALVGLLPRGLHATGSIVYSDRGQEVEIVDAAERAVNEVRGRVVSVIFQEPLTALDPLMRIGKQVAEPIRRFQGVRGSRLRRAVLGTLEEMQLKEPQRVADSFPYEVSGGQRQRAAIAMAMACRAPLLIADEATTALDVTVQAEILSLLNDLASQRGISLLVISHDLGVVSRVASEALVLQRGRVVESGSFESVVDMPRHEYTRSLITSARRLEDALSVEGER